MSRGIFTQFFYLSRRSVLRLVRQPEVVAPAILFPLLIFVLQASNLQTASDIPGFPADSYFDFLLAYPLVQGVIFAAVSAGVNMARDIESGFLDRLTMTPMRPVALLAGMLSGVIFLGIAQAAVFLSVGALLGTDIKAGILGVLVILGIEAVTALGFGGIGAILALRTGSGEAVQGLFPLLVVSVFISSVLLPRDLIATDWFRTVATYNPISYLVEGMRSLIISGWEPTELLEGIAVAFGLVAVSLTGAVLALRRRVGRT